MSNVDSLENTHNTNVTIKITAKNSWGRAPSTHPFLIKNFTPAPRRKLTLFIPPSTQSPLFAYGGGNGHDRGSIGHRSFLSLGDELYDDDDSDASIDINDEEEQGENGEEEEGGELSRTVSLPSRSDASQITREAPELDWLLEEHQRRYASVENSDNEDDEDQKFSYNRKSRYSRGSTGMLVNEGYNMNYGSVDDTNAEGDIVDYHGYQDESDAFNHFIKRVRKTRNSFLHSNGHSNTTVSGMYPELIKPRRNSRQSLNSTSHIPQHYIDLAEVEISNIKTTTFKQEFKILLISSIPLILTFSLEHITSLTSIIVVSHLGTTELDAVSLATMVSNIILAIFDGLSSALDTLLPQAYGSGNFNYVGLQLQRCSLLSMALLLPLGVIWCLSSEFILVYFIPDDPEVIRLTGEYLRVLIWGVPGYILFENVKHYLQAQGIYDAQTYVLMICTPINILLSYILVWDSAIGVGILGAAIAYVINFWMMFAFLVGYVVLVDGSECWDGFHLRLAMSNWKEIVRLGIPGMVMLEADSLAFEILTLFSSQFGKVFLAAQTAVSSLGSLIYMVSFSVGIGCSTRMANFVGAGQIADAKIVMRIGMIGAVMIGMINGGLLLLFRKKIALLFSNDEKVIQMIVDITPLISLATIFDSINAVSGCCLRGQGMQAIGGWINLLAYYAIGLPLAYWLGFIEKLELNGVWYGMLVGYMVITVWQGAVVLDADWDRIVKDANGRKEEYV